MSSAASSFCARPASLEQLVSSLPSLATWRVLGQPAADAPQCCMFTFDGASFDSALYAAAGIDLPSTIAASVRKRQAEFFFGRYAARLAMARIGAVTGVAEPDPASGSATVQIPIGAARQPLWPPALVGSITHHRDSAAAVVLPRAQYRGVGIDLENMVNAETLPALLTIAISPTELAYLRSCGAILALPVLATLVFSAK